jgi:hypothetical protein
MNLHSERYGTCEAFNTRRKGMCKAPLDEYGMCAVARDHGDSAEAPRDPVEKFIDRVPAKHKPRLGGAR